MTVDWPRHPTTGRWLAFDCETDCLERCAGLCGNMALEVDDETDR
jgi:hypothetical protein